MSTQTLEKPNTGTGRPCSCCSHPELRAINKAVFNRESFRTISSKYGMSDKSVYRHANNCLCIDSRLLNGHAKTTQIIDVYAEFEEQLAFAKQLREAAREYLSNISDPLRLSITPKAHEIEVTYFDHNDTETIGFGENAIKKPKKKVAQLSVLLESLVDAGLHPDKYKITTVDIRKFALDAINTADTCIDKFAKMGGDYKREGENPHDIERATTAMIQWLAGIVSMFRAFDESLEADQARIAKGLVMQTAGVGEQLEAVAKSLSMPVDKFRALPGIAERVIELEVDA